MKLLQSIKENEVLTDELRRHQRKLLRLNRDKYFLFERLLAYEKPPPKQAAPKEETIEIVDGVPKVVRVGKKRGPKPKKRDKSPPESSSSGLHLGSPTAFGQLMEPGQSLLKLKPKGRKKSGKKKDTFDQDEGGDQHMVTGSPLPQTSSSTSPVTFSPGFSKDKTVSSLKRSQVNKSSPHQHRSKMPYQSVMPTPDPTAPDDIMNEPVAHMNRSEFFRHDSFSNEMPDNLFDD